MFDSYNFNPLFDRLKKSNEIHNNEVLQSSLSYIEKYSDTNKEKAFMLVHFVKNNEDNLTDETKADILKEIKNSKLGDFFSLKKNTDNQDNDGFVTLLYIFTIGGLLLIVAGTIQLIRGGFWYGLGTKYLVPIFREGGFYIIMGFTLFVAGLTRIKHERRKKKFIQFLASQKLHTNSKERTKTT